MILQNKLGDDIDAAAEKARYDEHVKKLLAHKPILAWILQQSVKEFSEMSIPEIVPCIEGNPEVGITAVHRDDPDRRAIVSDSMIIGMNTEDSSSDEGKTYFDIRFLAVVPGSDTAIQLIINIEVQNKVNEGYPLENRIVYYLCRMISAQYGPVFQHSDYGKLRKVYSIWIIPDPVKYRRNTIWKMSLNGENVYGDDQTDPGAPDLMTGVILNLSGDEEESENKILKLLDVLLSSTKKPNEKKRILQDEYEIPLTEEVAKEVSGMCNLSEGIYDKGVQEGLKEGLKEGLEQGAIRQSVKIYREKLHMDDAGILNEIIKEFGLSRQDAEGYVLAPQTV